MFGESNETGYALWVKLVDTDASLAPGWEAPLKVSVKLVNHKDRKKSSSVCACPAPRR